MSILKKAFDYFKLTDTLAKEEKLQQAKTAKPKSTKPRKPRKPKTDLSAKELATKNNEPYVSVDKVEVDPTNPNLGNFQLDWNDLFIEQLKKSGYTGASEELIVDQWFQTVCRNILLETIENEAQRVDNVRYINRRIGPDGKTEVS